MAMKRCPVCGERYSDTYRDCPFCEEEEAYLDGEEIRRSVVYRGGRRVAGRRRMSLLTPTLIILILIMSGLLIYLLWGDQLGQKSEESSDTPPVTEVAPGSPVTPVKPEEDVELPSTVKPDTEKKEETAEPDEPPVETVEQTEYDKVYALPNGLVVSNPDFTLNNLGETHKVRASGGSGSYKWVSEDEGVASVDADGKITAISGGTVNVLVTDGSKKGVVIVRVKATGSLIEAPVSSSNTSTPATNGSHKLNREDITLKVGEKFQLKVTGVTTNPVWNSSKSSVVSITGDGTVTGVASGTSTVTVTWDGGSLSCIVRVK